MKLKIQKLKQIRVPKYSKLNFVKQYIPIEGSEVLSKRMLEFSKKEYEQRQIL